MGEHNLARAAERQVAEVGDYESLWFEGTWWTSAGLADRAARFATGLIELGLSPGDRVVVLMANCPEVLVSYTGIWRAGGVVTPLIFLVSAGELRAAVVDSGAVGVVTTAEFLPKVSEAVADLAGVRFVIVAGPTTGGQGLHVPVLDHLAVSAAEPGPIVDRADEDLAALLYTGGTTGRSKGVPLTHGNLFWCGWAGREVTKDDGLDVMLLPLPLAHVYGLLVSVVGFHQTEQHQTILMRWFDAAGWVALAGKHRAQHSALVPSMIQMLLTQPLEQADLSALVAVGSGAAPLAAEVRDEFEARTGATILEGYGCTESASVISGSTLRARRKGAVGRPVPGCAVRILDDEGNELPTGTDGEICTRSPGVMSGYWHAPEASATALEHGWLRTGDIGHQDADGYLYVVDRKKDLIIRGGFNVYPRDIEDVLLAHPAVGMAGVVGRPDPRLGEEVVAFVSLRPGATATPDELTQHVKERLAANKYPREIRILAQIPLTSVGKLDRKRLRAMVRAGEEGQ